VLLTSTCDVPEDADEEDAEAGAGSGYHHHHDHLHVRRDSRRRQAGMRRTSNQEGALQDLGIHGPDIVLDGVDKKMFAALQELDIAQRFIWPTRELNTNLSKAVRKDEKQRRRASNRKILSRKRRAEEAAVPSTLAGVHLLANVSVQLFPLQQVAPSRVVAW